jgi:hypothetical protein
MTEFVNPYLNYHRPCFFPEVTTNDKGKQIKKYPYKNMMTPYEKFKSLPNAEQYLKDNFSFDRLDDIVYQMSDNAAAKLMNKERTKLFNTIFGWK